MADKPKYYITTAIAYTSGKPHIGNTYEIVLADAIARYKRSQGYDVFFQTGTDEHGQKIELKAEEAGVTPKEFVDNVSGEIKRIWDLMNTSYDKFIRTTDDYHEKEVQKIFKKLYDQGDIYKGHYEGMYCTPCESFFTESQLVDGKCPDCGRPVQPAKEEAYFFKMSKYADRLIEYINTHPEFIQPVSRKNEMINVGGYKVNPHELEECIRECQGVIDVYVYAKDSKILGKIVCCDVVRENESITEKMIREQLRQKLQEFKIPRFFKFVEQLNVTRTGKISRKL